MSLKDTVKDLCKNKGVSVRALEIELGFANGYISKLDKSAPSSDKIQKIAEFFDVSMDYLMNGQQSNEQGYYLNNETAEMAQQIFENKELRLLFDAARDAPPEDLETVHSMLLALKRKERGNIDG